VDDALEMLVEGVDEPPAVPKETPAQMGQRLADEAFPTHYKITKRKIEKMVRKKIAARVRLPRASASMRIKFKLDLAPQLGIKAMCEEAGLVMKEGPMRCGSTMKRVWKADGPAATARFAQLNKEHPLGWGGAKLGAAPKGAKRKVSRVMTLLAPPLEVDHRTSSDEETATISAYLVTYNESGQLGLPPNHTKIWGEATEATTRLLTKYAKKMLGEMFIDLKPVSQTFLRNLGRQYASSGEDEDSGMDSDTDWSEGDDE
jgi:hypothetical protein